MENQNRTLIYMEGNISEPGEVVTGNDNASDALQEFPKRLYLKRYKEAQRLMSEIGLDGLMITGEENVFYFSGVRIFTPWTSFPRPNFVILPREGEPILYTNESHIAHATVASWIKEICSYSELTGPPISGITESLRKAGLSKGKIGAEIGYEQRINIPVQTLLSIEKEMGYRFVDASGLIWRMRSVKAEEEVDAVRRSCQILNTAYQEVFDAARPGMTEMEIAAMIRTSVCRQGAERTGFLVMNSATDAGKSDRSLPHVLALMSRPPSNRTLNRNDVVWIDSGAVYKAYNSDYSRVKCLGRPTDRQRRTYKTVSDLTHACIEAMKPGVKCSDINRLCNKWLRTACLDIRFEHGRIGHSVGLLLTEPPHIGLYDDTVMKRNMILTIEPGIITGYGAFHIEENVLIKADGPEILSQSESNLNTGFR